MTSRERLITVLEGKIPDCVPVAPDTSNMIPCRLTGLPFWDIYLYKKVPHWKAYIDCVKYFDYDSLMDGYTWIRIDEIDPTDKELQTAIVYKDNEKIVTREYKKVNGKYFWEPGAQAFFESNPPAPIKPSDLKLEEVPTNFEPLEGVTEWPEGEELLSLVKKEMGDHGLVGVFCGTTAFLNNDTDIYRFFDEPEYFYNKRDELLEYVEKRFNRLMSFKDAPDFICTGGSGTLVWQSVDTFRELGLPVAKKVIEMASERGVFTHVHSCGPEKELVKIFANETSLTVIDPLEIPPMGDCVLKELKQAYGDKIVLKGNLHTTDIMLNGTVEQVKTAAKRAIDDAAEGGKFILSTGDQCGRDTPDANIFAMIEVARTYGKY